LIAELQDKAGEKLTFVEERCPRCGAIRYPLKHRCYLCGLRYREGEDAGVSPYDPLTRKWAYRRFKIGVAIAGAFLISVVLILLVFFPFK
jgi:hypothetical protein